jgi:hypothetical protein
VDAGCKRNPYNGASSGDAQRAAHRDAIIETVSKSVLGNLEVCESVDAECHFLSQVSVRQIY